ncbi:fumarylacetoacetate hydrolase family protein [Hyunsoonleella sp. SJ7]|uniref:Fumarylacetoacetate hydrolase family protein n=1 Tax=Hyunsoonleella aquatilis TaxID=2762758 RepID=A0A923KJZ6_9FLAO|nr:fumarylacetoacetate hydrolase family protein [Hyunsoonleella aquatilis]MBC3757268.1 fumarylacetoacetate hydrolase family protein [Hyunsoonleella aquatilis]
MKLIRFGVLGQEKPGLLINGQRKDLSSVFNDWDKDFFNNEGLKKLDECLKNISIYPNVDESERWGACVSRPGKVICIGLNYSDHAEESGMAIPEEPIIFQKGSNTVVGPYDNIIIPRNSEKTDWEVELGVIIKKDTRYLNSIEEAKDCIAGYCTSHDVSERAFQLERGGQWTKGKSCDNFNPLGPYLVTSDEISDVQNLNMTLSVNGVQKQKGNTSFMIFDVCQVIHHLSQFMTLEAGDIINTGTPPGVGLGFNPPQYLKKGDIVQLEIEGLGGQKQVCVNA